MKLQPEQLETIKSASLTTHQLATILLALPSTPINTKEDPNDRDCWSDTLAADQPDWFKTHSWFQVGVIYNQ